MLPKYSVLSASTRTVELVQHVQAYLHPLDEIDKIHKELRAGFNSGKLKSIEYRKYQILQLGYLVKDNAERFADAIASDMGRPSLETNFLEVGSCIAEAKLIYNNVAKWAKTERGTFSLAFFAMNPTIRKEAKGVVLIISPFNFPMWLTLNPVMGAIAAGNSVCLKPSELAPATTALITELFQKYLDPDVVRVVNGAIPETTRLLELQWDHILYTGSGRVGRVVQAAAAKFLTPVSLELGGKSPVVIDPKCDLKTAARRIMWGKIVNAGQVCVAPDYVLVPKHFQDTFVKALKDVHDEFYPGGPANSPDFSRIVTPNHFARVSKLLADTKGTVFFGGDIDAEKKYIAPTIVTNVPKDDSLMSEEIFGPVLPIVPVENVDEAIEYINAHDHPLALYVFSQDAAFKARVFDNTQSGGAISNDILIHSGAEGLPFGGIGPSGTGYHTGKFTFDMFTHLRCSTDSPSWIDKILGSRYPPYTDEKHRSLKNMLIPNLPPRLAGPALASSKTWWGKRIILFLAFAFAAVLTRKRWNSV